MILEFIDQYRYVFAGVAIGSIVNQVTKIVSAFRGRNNRGRYEICSASKSKRFRS